MSASSPAAARHPSQRPPSPPLANVGDELRFAGLFQPGRGFVFPCAADGHVDLDGLGERARNNYFYARSSIGREFYFPVTCAVASQGF